MLNFAPEKRKKRKKTRRFNRNPILAVRFDAIIMIYLGKLIFWINEAFPSRESIALFVDSAKNCQNIMPNNRYNP
jgi:hypothetical protein